jgi:inosose dehydratase
VKFAFSKPTASHDEQHVLFSRYHSIGYDSLQLKSNQYGDYIEQPERFLDRWGHLPNVAAGLITGGTLDDAGIALLRQVLRFARAVQCERVIFWHAVPRQGLSDTDIQYFAETLSELGKEALQLNTKLSLHHHYNQPVMYRHDFDVFFDNVAADSVGLTVDTAHLVKSGITDIAGLISDFRHVIDNFHLKDLADGEWRVMGQGVIDFAPVFTAIQDIAFQGWVCADEESDSELVNAMETSYSFMAAGLSS